MTNNQRQLLKSLTSFPGWELVIDLMEKECDTAERELLGAPVTQPETVIKFHVRAQSFRMFFERFQKHLLAEINELPGEPLPVETPMEITRRQLGI